MGELKQVRAKDDQETSGLAEPVGCGRVESRVAVDVLHGDVGASTEQDLDGVQVAMENCLLEETHPDVVGGVDVEVRSVLSQDSHQLHIVLLLDSALEAHLGRE